jgi:putative transposase
MEHKISWAIVEVAVERQAATIAIGGVRDVADGVDKGKQTNQKISGWNHGQVRRMVEYKAEAHGISVILIDEVNTTKTCPKCGNLHKPRGRVYTCTNPLCDFSGHRDVVGQVNILSVHKLGKPGQIPMPRTIKHRLPVDIRRGRRRLDTGQARPAPVARQSHRREATRL